MESQYFRTFIGLPLQVGPSFLRARNDLLEVLGEEKISWTKPQHYHVTLRFIGNTEHSTINLIAKALREDIHVPEQIKLETSGVGSFGPRKRPRVIWVGFEESGFFDLIKQEVDRVLDLCGIPGEEQPFRAHLTLGRVRRLQNLQRYYNVIAGLDQQFKASILFDRLVFFRSILGVKGPAYQVLEEVQFLP